MAYFVIDNSNIKLFSGNPKEILIYFNLFLIKNRKALSIA